MKCWIISCVFGLLFSECFGSFANEDVEDQLEANLLLTYAKEQCGLNFGERISEAVNRDEVTRTLGEFSDNVDEVLGALGQLNTNPALASQNVVTGVNSLANSLGSVESSSKSALCSFLQLYAVSKRIEMGVPTIGLRNMGCSKTSEAFENLESAAEAQSTTIQALLATDQPIVDAISGAISSDLACVLQEVRDYKTFLGGIKSDLLGNAGISVREVLVKIAGLDAWGRLLVRNVGKLFEDVKDLVGTIKNLPPPPQNAGANSKLAEDLSDTLLKLKDILAGL